MAEIVHLADRTPQVSAEDLLAGFHPSYRFGEVSFDTYIPDPSHPSQAEAVNRLREFAASISGRRGGSGGRSAGSGGGLFGFLKGGKSGGKAGKKGATSATGIYLDGGFGVGKTHLLASTWHAAPGPKAFGTFVEYTNLVGALSFRKTVDVLKEYTLVCIDEFELDDPGDTVLMSRLMRELADAGVKLVATSNTLPGSLGDGRFAAQDFKREIQVLAEQFDVVRVDGEDYRHRGLTAAPAPLEDDQLEAVRAERFPEAAVVSEDDFADLTANLTRVHPSRYRKLVEDVDVMVLHHVETISEQAMALRFVVLADRLYDKDVPVIASGVPFDQLFTEEMMGGGYQKKYFRTVSRMTALVREGQMGETGL
ncbi:cell division protein ZapE [Citricoccus nitrophenolicus]|uniref:Cell division protein ZapE n=1 Tax=Citricoccus nitrophenolicus TaxID=863575 RepID=A0ABV0IDN3_9MICC|nr:cell division protein ZapE [Citricoccus sp. I39-566]WMY77255.1 cell division protein ZapE [Citricoccus sp. I39-566]